MAAKSFNSAIMAHRLPRLAAAEAAAEAPARGPLTVACVMLSAGQGGLEQSLLDYAGALAGEGLAVTAIVHPDWPGRAQLDAMGVPHLTHRSLNEWDPLALWRLHRLLRRLAPSAVLTIGRRASLLVRRARQRLPDLPQVAVTPNYSLEALIGLDHVLATTEDVRRALLAAGQPEAQITVVPNLICMPPPPSPRPREPGLEPVIGALGRFVHRKGFADLIDALALLRDRGRGFRAVIGGSGPEAPALRARVEAHGLAGRVTFPGWIEDKWAFFDSLDLFCVPSRQETFGIVVLEGFAHARPTVVTDAEGPREIVHDGLDGLVVAHSDPERLADALARLIDDPALRARLAAAGLATVRREYEQKVVGRRLAAVLREVVRSRSAARG